jgi:N-carbamoyl-L-amino-acid hydrolase
MSNGLDPQRTIGELKELRALTGDENGAQRVAFTDTWAKARELVPRALDGLPVEIHTERRAMSGRRCAAHPSVRCSSAGTSIRCRMVAGSTAVLNVLAGVEILRRINRAIRGSRR